MKNGQLKPAYNVQIGVEGEYIVGIDISSERSDQLTFIPFLDKLEKNLNKKYKSITADAGYESEENYTYLENNNQKAFIKPQTNQKLKSLKMILVKEKICTITKRMITIFVLLARNYFLKDLLQENQNQTLNQ